VRTRYWLFLTKNLCHRFLKNKDCKFFINEKMNYVLRGKRREINLLKMNNKFEKKLFLRVTLNS